MGSQQDSIGIVRIDPSFFTLGQIWFEKNEKNIQQQAKNPFSWWNNNYKEIDKDERISISALSRTLSDWGYQKATTIRHPGEFSVRGGIIDIFPINKKCAFRIEFQGNSVEQIVPLNHITTDPDILLKQSVIQPTDKRVRDEKTKHEYQKMLSSLQENSYVVHIDHGIGIFISTETIKDTEYLVLEYAEKDILRVPVATIGRITPYIGFTNPHLTRLGGNLWNKTKQTVKEDVIKTAQELIALYAQRELAQKKPYAIDYSLENLLEASFPFEETKDQRTAIEDIRKDLKSTTPMDRVVCGDVGFGKTEVAMRAAAMALGSGYQVALVAPTTVLAHQHYKTFVQRFTQTNEPVRIAKLTRIESTKDQKATIDDLSKNKVDIVIGTHRLLQKDVRFSTLGLIIIDEEQRFGVKQKEILKKDRAFIDVLSLSATPIPRTLSTALSGIRNISIITTPPQERHPIQTIVQKSNDTIIRNAIRAELKRDGQVYYLHNRILSLQQCVQRVQDLVPEARIAFLHAKLPEKIIIETIDAFAEHRIDVLISTTIMENGLDMANANTLIVENATMLGLAQAHQIRGRIGRSNTKAIAYFLYPSAKLPEKAKARIQALQESEALGSGYTIAMRDLEIRGAGNLLGREQSGHIARIGFNLYCQMLNEAVEELQRKKT